MYAIIETGGKQYKVNEGDVIYVEKLGVNEGDTVEFEVEAVSTNDGFKVGTPTVEGAVATVDTRIATAKQEAIDAMCKYYERFDFRDLYSRDEIIFSDKANSDIKVISSAALEIMDIAKTALIGDNVEIAKMVEPLEQVIDALNRKIKSGHIERLRQGDCTMELGFILSDVTTNFERVADHCSNIAGCLIETRHGSMDLHKYLRSVKHGDTEFSDYFSFIALLADY